MFSKTNVIPFIYREGLQKLYGLSYIWFSSIGILIVVIVGLFVSFVTGMFKFNRYISDTILFFVRPF